MNSPLALLSQLTPAQFLTEYWQKKPLLIRQAIPNFKGLLTPNELAGLSCEEDVQSRIIQQQNKKWRVKQGPFCAHDFTKLPEKDWTLLVQNVNHHLPEAAELLKKFNFIPHARLDDLMVSYAPDGSGIGPHFDSYDVFLLQGSGKRNWKISSQQDFNLNKDAPIKVISDFVAEQEWTLEAGDMLYLPPQFAHCGMAVGEDCMTYSIGFRASKAQELIHEFLIYLQDNTSAEGLYADPGLSLQQHPAEISDLMVEKVKQILEKITWDKSDVGEFLGRYLTEPKPDVFFEPPRKIMVADFAKKLSKKPLLLNLKSQMLFQQNAFYINGESFAVPTPLIDCIQHLADQRFLDTVSLNRIEQQALANTLYEAYIAGYVNF